MFELIAQASICGGRHGSRLRSVSRKAIVALNISLNELIDELSHHRDGYIGVDTRVAGITVVD